MAEETKKQTQELLPLDLSERIVVFRSKGATRRHVFRRLTDKDWGGFFDQFIFESRRAGQATIERTDVRTASLWLYDRAIVRVEGYALTDMRALMELANWKERVPFGDRLAAVDVLMKVVEHDSDELVALDPERDVVLLDATWAEGDGGQMKIYRRLAHRFTPPSAEDQRRMNRFLTEARIVGGSRVGRTIYPIRHKVFADLYDQLIRSVEGYSVGGRELESVDAIRREMDCFHKVAAMTSLFALTAEPEEEGAEER